MRMTRRKRKYLTASKLRNSPNSRETFSFFKGFGIEPESMVLSVTPLIALSLSSVADHLMLEYKKTDFCLVELFSLAHQPLACGHLFSEQSHQHIVFQSKHRGFSWCFQNCCLGNYKPLVQGESWLVLFVQLLYLYSG